MQNTESQPGSQDSIAESVQSATETAQEAINQTGEELARQTDQLKEVVASVSEAAQQAVTALGEQITSGAKATDEAIRRNPYMAMGIALGVGCLAGYLIKRR